VAEGARLPPGYRPDRHRAPLVGRDDEVALLSHTLDLAIGQGRAALLLLVGDAGVGKSRVVEQVAEVARGCHDGLVLQGRCVPYGEVNVWWPLAEAVRSGCNLEPGDDQEAATDKVRAVVAEVTGTGDETDRIVEGVLHLLGFDVLRGIDVARARDQATGALLAFAAAVARRRPLVIVLSDLHWADRAVLGVLEALLERNARQPIVVLATARPALAERWSPPEGGHHSVTVHVDPLSRDAASQVLHLLADEKTVALDDAVIAELLDRAGGNPLFLEELVSWLEEARSTALPDTLRGLVAARLDGLTPQERLVLEDAAVLGSRGHVEWLATMHREAHGGDGAVRSVVGGLQVKDLLALDGESWEFRSEVVREVTYGTMTKERRATVHAGIAWWLEHEERPHHDAVVDRIAHHYARAAALTAELGGSPGVPRDVGARAVRWLRAAGDRATQADTPRRAAHLFSEALTALDSAPTDAAQGGVPADTDDRIALLLARSAAYAELREVGPARADADAALGLAEAAGDERAAVRATVAVAEAALRGSSPDEAEALLAEALARADAAGDCCATTPRRRSRPSSPHGTSTRHRAIGAGLPGPCRTSHGHTSSPGASTTRKPFSTSRQPFSPISVTGVGWDGRWACWRSRASIPATPTRRRPWPSRSSAVPRRQATAGPWAWDRCSPPAFGCGRDGPSRPSSGPGRRWRPSTPSTTTTAGCRRSSRWGGRW
jgi:predicted ATPase